MSFTVTGMFAAPDVGFKAQRRMTARGAKDLAAAFRAEGRVYVEIRNDRGEIIDRERLDRAIGENGASEDELTRRLAPTRRESSLSPHWPSTGGYAPPSGFAETD